MEKELIKKFSEKMLAKIELRNDRYVSMGWRTLDFKRLMDLLYGEISELYDAYNDGDLEHAKSVRIKG